MGFGFGRGPFLYAFFLAKPACVREDKGNPGLRDEEHLPNRTNSTYGLQVSALGPVETLAQSVSAVSPTTGSSLTVPLVFALAGNGTWLVYLLATVSILLVAWCISRFARRSASPG